MNDWTKSNLELDYAELYRQNYEDALDEIRNLKFEIADLQYENERLREQINFEDDYILNRYRTDFY